MNTQVDLILHSRLAAYPLDLASGKAHIVALSDAFKIRRIGPRGD
jgi:hypothetical protein